MFVSSHYVVIQSVTPTAMNIKIMIRVKEEKEVNNISINFVKSNLYLLNDVCSVWNT